MPVPICGAVSWSARKPCRPSPCIAHGNRCTDRGRDDALCLRAWWPRRNRSEGRTDLGAKAALPNERGPHQLRYKSCWLYRASRQNPPFLSLNMGLEICFVKYTLLSNCHKG